MIFSFDLDDQNKNEYELNRSAYVTQQNEILLKMIIIKLRVWFQHNQNSKNTEAKLISIWFQFFSVVGRSNAYIYKSLHRKNS